jgi:VWFA-related protein
MMLVLKKAVTRVIATKMVQSLADIPMDQDENSVSFRLCDRLFSGEIMQLRCRLPIFVTMCCLAVGAAGVYAQEPPDATTTLKLSTRIVVLDVVVTDKKGNLVLDQTRDDFTIVEDRVPQTLRSFEPPATHVLPPNVVVNSAADLNKIGDAPVTLLVLDELNTRFEDMVYSRGSMVKYLLTQPKVLKQPTVLLLASNTRFIQLHDYTQDRDALIDQIKHRMPEYPRKMMGGAGAERLAQTIASLEQIAQASSGTPGRKNVVWVGMGFPSVGLVSLDEKTAETLEAAIKQCMNMLLAARVTMYTINPLANSTATQVIETPDDLAMAESDMAGDPFEEGISFGQLAPATGGRAFLSRNDINNEIGEGIAAGNNYYTLSYAPSNRTDDAAKYRNIRIVMKNPNLRATTRDGYYPLTVASTNAALTEPPKQAKAQLGLDLASAVNSAISYNGLGIRVTGTKPGAYEVSVKSAGLDWRANGTRELTESTVMAAWYSPKGKLLGHAARELTATRPADTNALNPPDTVFVLPVTIPPGAARVRFIVRDAVNGHIGTADLTKY